MIKKGNIFIFLLILIGLAAGGFLLWNNIQMLRSMGEDIESYLPFGNQTSKPDDISNWITYKNSNGEISFKMPPNWFDSKEDYISQYPYKRGYKDNIFNLIDVSKVKYQLHTGYINKEWFEIMYGLQLNKAFKNEYHEIDNLQNIKIDKGTSTFGYRYVVTRDEASGPIKTYILNNSDLYLVSLSFYDDFGLVTYNKILKTVNIISQ